LLGLTEEQLVQMYRSQFGVLRKYEHSSVFDANGRRIARHHQHHGFVHERWEAEARANRPARGEPHLGMWQRVEAWQAGDTSVDLGPFVPPFVPSDREAAMSRAYRTFAAMLAAK
jgi:hypothetical protein